MARSGTLQPGFCAGVLAFCSRRFAPPNGSPDLDQHALALDMHSHVWDFRVRTHRQPDRRAAQILGWQRRTAMRRQAIARPAWESFAPLTDSVARRPLQEHSRPMLRKRSMGLPALCGPARGATRLFRTNRPLTQRQTTPHGGAFRRRPPADYTALYSAPGIRTFPVFARPSPPWHRWPIQRRRASFTPAAS